MRRITLGICLIGLLLFTPNGFSKEKERDNAPTAQKRTQTSKAEKKQQSGKVEPKNDTSPAQTIPENPPQPRLPENIEYPSLSLTGEQINWQVISSGGGTGSSTSFILSGTAGQTAVGFASSTNFQVNSGYWQVFTTGSGGCCLGLTGNVNTDPSVNDILDISDLLYLVDFFFLSPPGPAPICPEEADVNASGVLDISDLLYLVDYFFLSPPGPAPEPCL